MKTFTFKVTGYYTVFVDDDVENDEEKAREEICEVDFGHLEDIDSEIIDVGIMDN